MKLFVMRNICLLFLAVFSGILWLFSLTFLCSKAAYAFILPQSHHSAFSFHFHLPKSIYEGNFGCGYLKERRASGLVFCENTTSLYRALFVSSLVLFVLYLFSARVWISATKATHSSGMRACNLFSCMVSTSVHCFCAIFIAF